jgi:hypothetical protein
VVAEQFTEVEMQKLRFSYLIAIVLVWFINGYALLQHLAVVPEIDGFVAAALLLNILTAPVIMWAAYGFGRIAGERFRRKHQRAAMAR